MVKKLIQFIVPALIVSLGIWPGISKTGEVRAEISAFDVSLSSLKTETKPLYYRGMPLGTNNPSMKYLDGQEALATGKKFPNALSCLSFDPEDATVSLARLNTRQFETIADLEICLQRVGNELDDLSKVEPWLHAIGFASAGERPISYWLPANSLGVNAEEVVVFYAQWRNGDSYIGRGYPIDIKNSWSKGFLAKNMDLTLVVRRRDLRVISVNAVMIFL